MALAMYQYQDDQRNNPGKTSVDDLVRQIKTIAHGEYLTFGIWNVQFFSTIDQYSAYV